MNWVNSLNWLKKLLNEAGPTTRTNKQNNNKINVQFSCLILHPCTLPRWSSEQLQYSDNNYSSVSHLKTSTWYTICYKRLTPWLNVSRRARWHTLPVPVHLTVVHITKVTQVESHTYHFELILVCKPAKKSLPLSFLCKVSTYS